MKKRRRSIRDAYKSVRKPVPPPTRVEPDRREKLRRSQDEKEIEDQTKRGKREKNMGEEQQR
ncbi:MAG: hypothetical protein JJE48_07325 [Actinobacteria bacterium]|nr:hypothetical protein [Actinomycetota bacterium]